ncbi:sodium channel protein type 5 subunit alpha-like isoform X3 [Hemicordylus capensis]|nr:sodium channel protein type 5 subunit alpha-like isoform X3 [Hemicordylus capensis]XP_053122283.1 sodium channel protein type 5 subunit alpha-like isoform X3 [Hemicordylus capensis]XP_053122284.1 sodium channel protein type 5 subunit alpha-like isoform X3 [Hemicordylus capensis]XP_053122285.1 sodium channel protein type 5 subunit alpha-like isoform X3 [Hemicordylus capensis]XP_053122286.1 sodium channel protein type 5 subunit alpha-like isoform X3 [Hemicordylus capensis]XP_053122288.1 sodiu
MPNFSFSTANNFLRFTPETLDGIRKRIAEKKAKRARNLELGRDEQEEEENIRPQLDLKVFKKLPALYGKPPPWLIGEPLEDVDPYYRDRKSFMVLTARNRIFRFTATKALFLLSPFHPLRRLAIKVLVHLLFMTFITCVVLVNCVFMTLNKLPQDNNITETVFTTIYTAEFAIKVVARGFVLNQFTYLRDPWNILDFFVLIMTYVALSSSLGSFSALRIFRVLRSLKAISVIPGLKVIIASLLHSVKQLSNVMLLTVFCLAVFALVGLQLFMGNLRHYCVNPNCIAFDKNTSWSCAAFEAAVLTSPSPGDGGTTVGPAPRGATEEPEGQGSGSGILPQEENSIYHKMNCDHSNPLPCGFSWDPNKTECLNGYKCLKCGDDVDYEDRSFDHFGWAFLSMFRLMTQDSWELLYRKVIRTSGKSYSIFFVIVIFLCSFYLFNLILAVVIMAYEEQHKATLAHTKAREMLLQKAKEILKKEQELSIKRHVDKNVEMPVQESKNNKKSKSKWKKAYKSIKSKTYGEDETMFYSPPDKNQKELKEVLMSYRLPIDTLNDPFQRQKLTSAAHVLSKTMEWEESKLEFPPGLKRATQKFLIWQCCPLWLHIKERVKKVIINPFTELFIILCIIMNSLLIALQYILFSEECVEKWNKIFTGIFTTEMILKLIALDPYYYFQQAWNIFDFTVVIITVISMGLDVSGLSIFRMMRIFKLSKFWPALNKLMKIMMKSVGPLGNLTLVLMFTIFIFAVVGKQGFGNYYNINRTDPKCVHKSSYDTSEICQFRWHMGDFLHSFLIIFRILCGEWIETMWDCMRVAHHGWCIIMFMLVLVIGNLVVLNLFIALLLSSFSSSIPESEAEEKDPNVQMALTYIRRNFQLIKHLLWDSCCNVFMQKKKTACTKHRQMTITTQKDNTIELMEEIQANARNETFRNLERASVNEKQEDVVTNSKKVDHAPLAEMEYLTDEEEHTVIEVDYKEEENKLKNRREQLKRTRRRSSQISESISVWSLDVPKWSDHDISYSETSTIDQTAPACLLPSKKKEPEDCFPQALIKLFPSCVISTDTFLSNRWWNLRKTCYKIIIHSWFESFIIFMILFSSVTLIFEDVYLEERPFIKNLLKYADSFFFYIFFLEMLLKWVAYGFKKYFTSAWCWLDFFIVCVSFVSLYQTIGTPSEIMCDNKSSVKSLRTLRALRPLRALSRFKGIKVVVNALIGAIPSIGNVLLVCVVLWLPFNVLGVGLFRGKFGNVATNATAEHICELPNSTWEPSSINFDHVGKGYLALLQVATFKGWIPIMDAAVDAPDRKCSPTAFERNKYAYLYFVAFIIFGSFFMLNLFIGVVIDNFNQQRKKISGELIFLSDEQKKYYNALKKLSTKKPHKRIPRPLNKYQGLLFDIVNKQAFDIFIISLIFFNVVVMAMEHDGQEEAVGNFLEIINAVFVAIFTGECLMKILALRLYFFKDNWNIFDFVVVILSILSAAIKNLPINFPPTILRIIRVVRISRILRLIRAARGIRTLLFALLMSLPALANIGLLLFLIMFIYAIFGMKNFACAGCGDHIDNIFNFQTFGGSMLCLLQMTTSAGWDGLLHDMLDSINASCFPNVTMMHLNRASVTNGVAIGYFVSYIIISFLIVVNMYIAVIIENFSIASEESTEPLDEDDFDIFYETWAKFDPQATQFITYSALSDFADALVEPLRIPKPNRQQLIAMDLPMVNGSKIHCLDILFAFTKRVLGETGEMDALETQIEGKYPKKIAYEPIVTTLRRKQDEAAIIIQRAFRMHLLQRVTREAHTPLEDIPEEEGGSEFRLNASEDSQSVRSQSPSSISIPPSYSNVSGTTDNIPQMIITDSRNATK